ncbi:MAG: porphobilinogen synthase [Bacillota bacterium]
MFPIIRPRRLRENPILRSLVRENCLHISDLILPMFVTHGSRVKNPISSMPGVFQFSIDELLKEIQQIIKVGISSILLFGIPATKDATGSEAYSHSGIVQQAVKAIKKEFPNLLVITDVCLCEYTDHGHCGIVHQQKIVNDSTLDLLNKTALSHCEAGADMVAPSDMMDGRIGAIRRELDSNGFNLIPIMAYSAKYASKFYGPFREAAGSTPVFGDRQSYQMDTANAREALKEVELDILEGADIVMVKPALAYMDIIKSIKDKYNYPVAAYNVSGEYVMIKAASAQGWIDEKGIVLEIMLSLKRAGTDIIITYFAKDIAQWLHNEM